MKWSNPFSWLGSRRPRWGSDIAKDLLIPEFQRGLPFSGDPVENEKKRLRKVYDAMDRQMKDKGKPETPEKIMLYVSAAAYRIVEDMYDMEFHSPAHKAEIDRITSAVRQIEKDLGIEEEKD